MQFLSFNHTEGYTIISCATTMVWRTEKSVSPHLHWDL